MASADPPAVPFDHSAEQSADSSRRIQLGYEWLDSVAAALFFVPSAIVPISDGPDQNVLTNPRHPAAARIKIARIDPFELDVRLFKG
ncbi:MAG: hypothetical protein EOR81_01750 [Mesorhizobium sp.]|nr:MAG: hypothetical protein EOR81_01750 [Mesorhizobium sp.]